MCTHLLPYDPKQIVFTLLEVPLRIPKTRKKSKVKYVTVNALMRVHHKSMHSIKTRMYGVYEKLLKSVTSPKKPFKGKYTALFVYYAPDRRKRDVSNMCAFTDKFLMDTLVKNNILDDDDCRTVFATHYVYGGVVKDSNYINFYLIKE